MVQEDIEGNACSGCARVHPWSGVASFRFFPSCLLIFTSPSELKPSVISTWMGVHTNSSWSRSECSETLESILVLECSEMFALILVLGDLAIFELTLTPESLKILDWPRTFWPCPSSFLMSLTTTGTAFQIPGEIRRRSWVLA